ncbi:General stress protein 39 [Paenibacillus plantiphilus]|uniref:General stress protein 39 n=1 Tax=Paenibacillus plantiphilus TaxID=2905650 RepID=A0ABN8GGG1_9BACL|nr:SDR family oxidoreductase [Paenibacillus plantiphilus]CAH1206764.1 General stress protein 39 [Paenibacillus plantiphilus]
MAGNNATEQRPKKLPPQEQEGTGLESKMNPMPEIESPTYRAAGKLTGRTALITGGDSGIGHAAAVAFAKEGADVAIVYLEQDEDANKVKKRVEELGRKCLLIRGDIGDEAFSQSAIEQTVKELGQLDILVNNAAEQHPQQSIEDITAEQLEKTFRTNIFAMFYLTKAAMKHLKKGASIINTASITAYEGNPTLIDYSSTKGAIVSFTRALANSLANQGIRVNAVAPGPIWTPLIPSTFPAERVAKFGTDTPLGRPGQPSELAPAYVYLASDDSSYVSGQTIHINGGTVVNG